MSVEFTAYKTNYQTNTVAKSRCRR